MNGNRNALAGGSDDEPKLPVKTLPVWAGAITVVLGAVKIGTEVVEIVRGVVPPPVAAGNPSAAPIAVQTARFGIARVTVGRGIVNVQVREPTRRFLPTDIV